MHSRLSAVYIYDIHCSAELRRYLWQFRPPRCCYPGCDSFGLWKMISNKQTVIYVDMICDIDTIWIDMICLRNLNDRHVWSVHRRCCLCLYNIVEPASYSNSNTDMHCMYLHCVFYTAHRPFFLQNLRGSQRIFWPCEVYANFTKTFCGSYGYAAPEVNPRRQAFSEKAGKEFRVKSSDFKSLWSRWFIGDS